MPAAYTPYKFGKIFQIVFAIMILLAAFSIINPILLNAQNQAVGAVTKAMPESNNIERTYEAYSKLPDPKGTIKQETGSELYKLMNNNPQGFVVLGFGVTIVFFIFGVRLKTLRGILNRL